MTTTGGPGRLRSWLAAAGGAVLLGAGAGLLPLSAAQAAEVTVEDVEFSWSINDESGGGAFFGGCNFLVAGKVGDLGSSKVWSAADAEQWYKAEDGNVSIRKPGADGDWLTPTWENKCLDARLADENNPDGTRVTTGGPARNSTTKNEFVYSGGSGTVDMESGTGEISWDGDVSIVYYGGMTYWSFSDPTLELHGDGTGTITATASGYGASMSDPTLWEEIAPQEITIADLSDVEITEDGFTVTPDYLGVEIDPGEGAVDSMPPRWDVEHAGSFPQSWVEFNFLTGQGSYWYSSGGVVDRKKPTNPLTVSWQLPEEDPLLEVEGAQFQWTYSGYAQRGVFSTWRQWAKGENVAVRTFNGQSITGNPADADAAFLGGVFDGGTGSLDPETGAGTITWEGTGEWGLNSYPANFGAPDQLYSDPVLSIDEDGSGELTVVARIPGGGVDMEGNPTGGHGPERLPIATFSEVELSEDGLRIESDFEGVQPPELYGTEMELPACEHPSGSWPAEFIEFMAGGGFASHYFTTGCGGMQEHKPPMPIEIDFAPSAPEFVTEPELPADADLNQPVTFTAEATGNPAPAYTWQVRENADAEWQDAEATWAEGPGSRLVLEAGTASVGTQIRVTATNGHGDVVSGTTIDGTEPVLTQQPANRRIGLGSSTYFQVRAAGIPEPAVTWQRSDDGGETWTDLGEGIAGSRDDEHRYPVDEPSLEDSGALFRAVLTNSAGQVFSDAATLEVVLEMPNITQQPSDALRYEGESISISFAQDALPYPEREWQYSPDGEEWTVLQDRTGTTLPLSDLKAEDSGWYRVLLTNGAGSVLSEAARLTVLPAPETRQVATRPAAPIPVAEEGQTSFEYRAGGFTVDDGTPAGNAYIAVMRAEDWQPGQAPAVAENGLPADPLARGTMIRSNLERGNGIWGSTLRIPEGALEPGVEYGIAVFHQNPAERYWDFWQPLEFDFGDEQEPSPTPPAEEPTEEPTESPTGEPTAEPTSTPTEDPGTEPSTEPTEEPTGAPTDEPTTGPTAEPSPEPTSGPTDEPTVEPTPGPTEEPAPEPEGRVEVSQDEFVIGEESTVTVTGTGFTASGREGSYGPAAGTEPGFYVGFGDFAEDWRPSAGAPSSARTWLTSFWAIPQAAYDALDEDDRDRYIPFDLEAGTFEAELEVAHPEQVDGILGVYTLAAGGGTVAGYETATPLRFAEPSPGTPEPSQEPTPVPTDGPNEPSPSPDPEPTAGPSDPEPSPEPTDAPGEPEPTDAPGEPGPTDAPTVEPTAPAPSPEPTDEPTAEPSEQPSEPGSPGEPGQPAEPGEDITVEVDAGKPGAPIRVSGLDAYEGQEIRAELHSEPVDLGAVTVRDGVAVFTVPDIAPGTHTLFVFDAEGTVLYEGEFEVLAADDPGTPAEPSLAVAPERITPEAFVDPERGVIATASGIEPGGEVTFVVTPDGDAVTGLSETVTADEDGQASFRIYGVEPADPSIYLGAYTVRVEGTDLSATFEVAADAPVEPAPGGGPDGEPAPGGDPAGEPGGSVPDGSGGSEPGGSGSGSGSGGGTLPKTGSELAGLGLGLVLIAAGAAGLHFGRRRDG
ncbi:hypothetical protein GCM10027079_07270 [Sediminivirga luteola]|uniref:Ig-like domain-containing protein n=1 Tax=Sediminivirga luteola TaxID=1774748 RepID=A0A8J2U0Y9_9MICO|nr:hypothetical protein GCM10011333_31970 [Sediminivirga luteola]